MKTIDTNEWDQRVGSAAVASLRKANRFLTGNYAAVALAVAGILVTKQLGPKGVPLLWTCITVAFTYTLVIHPIGYWGFARRGGREAAIYIGLSNYSRRTRVPIAALKSPRAFDNFMVQEGIPPRPGYVPDPAPRAYELAEALKQKREKALQRKQTK